MFKETGGFHNFKDAEVEDAKKNGWVDGNPIRKKLLAAMRVSASISPHPQSTEIGAFNPE